MHNKYKDGARNGPVVMYFQSGKKRAEGTFINGKLEGVISSWYENGQIQIEETWKNGIRVKSFVWSKDGRMSEERLDDKGEIIN